MMTVWKILFLSANLSMAVVCQTGCDLESVAAANPNSDPAADSKEEIRAHLVRESRHITDQAAQELSSKQRWEEVRERRRKEMRDMLGLEPLPARTPLNVRIAGKMELDEFFVEKISFESLPQVYVTSNLYIPKEGSGPYPAVIYVCGHAFSPYGNKTAYQRHPITFARHGYVSLIIDSIQIAETFALHHGVSNNEMYDWYSRGYTPAGLEVWNVMRALDYLQTRPEVDADRFGITGRSGGAAMSWFSAAIDDRIKVVVPVMGISTYAANVSADTQRLHCDCMFTINTFLHDMMHQGALIAPRPLLMAHGREDALFPLEGYEAFEATISELYRQYEADDQFENLVVEGGHQDSDYLRAEAVRWFDRWLKKVPEREIDTSYVEIPAEQLAVFGGDPPADARNYRVHEFFGPTRPSGIAVDTVTEWKVRSDDLKHLLRERVFGAFAEEPTPITARRGDLVVPQGWESLRLETEAGIQVQAAFRSGEEPEAPALLYVASDGEDLVSIRRTLRQTTNGSRNSVLVVYPRGVGVVAWEKAFWKGILRNAMHVGRTVDSMRVWDVLQATRVLRERSRAPVVATGIGTAAILALYAAVLDEEIREVILIKPPSSHEAGPVLLNVLRYTDLPEVAALMAPRRLTFYGRIPNGFEATRDIFALVGLPDHISLTMSIDAALNGRHHHNFASGL